VLRISAEGTLAVELLRVPAGAMAGVLGSGAGSLVLLSAPPSLDAKSAHAQYDKGMQEARKAFPHLAGGPKQKHHVQPWYLGGPEDGPPVDLDPAYHQLITSEFRRPPWSPFLTMRETIEVRLFADDARQFLPPTVGREMGMTRRVVLELDDPLVERIRQYELEKRRNGSIAVTFSGSRCVRSSSPQGKTAARCMTRRRRAPSVASEPGRRVPFTWI
jgi:hypothetical protein